MIRGGQKGFEVWIGLIEHARTIHDAHISAPMCLFLSADKGQGTWHGGLPAFLSSEANLTMCPGTPLWSMPAADV